MNVHFCAREYQDAFSMECIRCFKMEFVVAGKFLDVLFLAHLIFLVLVNDVDHLRGELRIELRAHFLDEDLSYGCLRKRIPVASFRCHGIIGICYCDYPCDLRDIFSLELIRITSTVKTFMMIIGTDA